MNGAQSFESFVSLSEKKVPINRGQPIRIAIIVVDPKAIWLPRGL